MDRGGNDSPVYCVLSRRMSTQVELCFVVGLVQAYPNLWERGSSIQSLPGARSLPRQSQALLLWSLFSGRRTRKKRKSPWEQGETYPVTARRQVLSASYLGCFRGRCSLAGGPQPASADDDGGGGGGPHQPTWQGERGSAPAHPRELPQQEGEGVQAVTNTQFCVCVDTVLSCSCQS